MADPSPPPEVEPAAEVQDAAAETENGAVKQQQQQQQQQQMSPQMSQQMHQQLIHQQQLQEGQMTMGLGAMPPMPFHIKPGQPVPQYLPMGAPPMGMPIGMMPPGMQQMMPGMQMPPQGLYFPPPDARDMGKQGQFPPWAMGGPSGSSHGPQYRYPKGGGSDRGGGGGGGGGGGDRGGGGGRGGDGGGRNGDGNGGGGRRRDTGALSKTNIYISGLKSTTTDEDLRALCQSYGTIVSAKAIIDRDLNQCKGYGFVMFEKESSAKDAVDALIRSGAQAAFAKVTRAQVEWQGRQEADPTNLYLTNLPKDQDESALSAMLLNCLEQQVKGEIVSCRVLRDAQGLSRGVGLARMDCREACDVIIKRLNGCVLPGCVDPLRVKFANSPSPRKFKFLQRSGGRMQPNMQDSSMGGRAYDPSVAEMGFPGPVPGAGLEIGMQGMHIDPAILAAQRTQAMMMAQIQPGQTPQVWGLGEGGPDGTPPAGAGTGAAAEGAGPPLESVASNPAAAPAVAAATMAAAVADNSGDGDGNGGGDESAASSAQNNAKRVANNKFMQGSMVNKAATNAYEQYIQTSTHTAGGVLGARGARGSKGKPQ